MNSRKAYAVRAVVELAVADRPAEEVRELRMPQEVLAELTADTLIEDILSRLGRKWGVTGIRASGTYEGGTRVEVRLLGEVPGRDPNVAKKDARDDLDTLGGEVELLEVF